MNQFTHSFYFFQNQLSNGKKDKITGDGGVDLSGNTGRKIRGLTQNFKSKDKVQIS